MGVAIASVIPSTVVLMVNQPVSAVDVDRVASVKGTTMDAETTSATDLDC